MPRKNDIDRQTADAKRARETSAGANYVSIAPPLVE